MPGFTDGKYKCYCRDAYMPGFIEGKCDYTDAYMPGFTEDR